MDALARQFAATHDMKVKDEIDRFAKEHGKLREPWMFVAINFSEDQGTDRGHRSPQWDDCSDPARVSLFDHRKTRVIDRSNLAI